jgi:signal transduction histidine kinase
VVEVTDAGDFEPDPKLFAAFTQADMSTRRERGGLGLGLFVSARLCELGRGRLDLRREDGRTVAEARFRLRD